MGTSALGRVEKKLDDGTIGHWLFYDDKFQYYNYFLYERDPGMEKLPMGLWEMTQDSKKLNDYLSNIKGVYNEISSLTATTPLERAHIALQELKNDFSRIQNQLKDLYANRQKIIDLGLDSSSGKPIKPDNRLFKDLYYLRETLEKDLEQIRSRIAQFKKEMPDSKDKDNLIAQLEKVCDDLESQIPEPDSDYGTDSGNWKPRPNALVDRKGEETRLRFWWKENEGDKAKVVKWKDSGDTSLPKNPLGIFEMVIDSDRSKYKKFLDTLSKGTNLINEFYQTTGSKPLHLFLLKDMNTQSAYVYMIVILLPLLQNQAAESLEEQGQTMKKVSQLYDEWNEIQNEINEMGKQAKIFKEKGIFNENNVEFEHIGDYTNEDGVRKILWISDPNKEFGILFIHRKNINEKISRFKSQLDQIEEKLPSTSKELITILRRMAENLILPGSYSGYYHDNTPGRFHLEIPIGDERFPLDVSNEEIKKYVSNLLENDFGFFNSSDQTRLKTYMDNIAQGITALTSISNMTQQQLQINTQYYNSLLGFQKSAQDSLNKIIQTAINSMR